MLSLETPFTRQAGIRYPIIGGAMYPCSNPELVAAISQGGGIGIVQPVSLSYVFGYDLRVGLRYIRALTSKPVGFNALIEASSKVYLERMHRWVDIALEEGIRFFITALGNPRWVVDRVHAAGGVVYHDATERTWALKALEQGVDGLICVNDRAGGHAGRLSPAQLMNELRDLGKPLICAGGVGDAKEFVRALDLGYAGVQIGTRFIATEECRVHADYKQAIVAADERDVVLTEKLTGVPVSIIKTPYVERVGTRAGPLARWLLRGARTKHWMRSYYSLLSVWQLKRASLRGLRHLDYFQAGKSVAGIHAIEPVGAIIQRFVDAAQSRGRARAAKTPAPSPIAS